MGARELTSERVENLPSTRRRVLMTEDFSEEWDVEIIPYTPQYRADFERITREWFEEYHLSVEPFDERLFADPDQVLATGGAIFFARCCDEIVGSCGVMKHSDPEEFELIKLGVRRLYRGMHIGQRLVQAALEHTRRSASPQRIVLYTNTRLVVARFLYLAFYQFE